MERKVEKDSYATLSDIFNAFPLRFRSEQISITSVFIHLQQLCRRMENDAGEFIRLSANLEFQRTIVCVCVDVAS